MSNEEFPLLEPTKIGSNSCTVSDETESNCRRQQMKLQSNFIAASFAVGGTFAAILALSNLFGTNTNGRKQFQRHPEVPLLGSPLHGKRTENGIAPFPSEQDWCMAPGKYKFLGTYRSIAENDTAEGGLLYAPGRFEGTLLTAQDDEVVYFHLVNMTYGNSMSPNHHFPNEDKADVELDVMDVYCFIYSNPSTPSGCFAPKHFPEGRYPNTRCGKIEFPSAPGLALCRALSMANFDFDGYHTMGAGDIKVEEWKARLSKDDPDAPNEYNGELHLFMRNVPGGGDSSSLPQLKIPLVHWLTSDDQQLEASFHVMDWDPSWDPKNTPLPQGCEEAIDISTDSQRPEAWNLDNMKCPFGAMHRHLALPTWHNYNHN